jgi:predicted regulator of Ras-like GTPase activity (Roadblock/LC7/MglB family)
MDAQQALADLTEISSQIRAAVVFDEQAKVAASTLADDARAEAFARAAADLLAAAEAVQRSSDAPELAQLEAATAEGSVFVVREGNTRIAATTSAEPTVGLVFYDLKSALRNIDAKPERKGRTRRRSAAAEPDAAPKKPAAKKPAAKKAAAKKPAATRKKDDAA